MGRRVTAKEFEEWRVMFAVEGWHRRTQLRRHRRVLAALANGPLIKRSKKLWTTDDFGADDPWADPPEKVKQTPSAIAAQVKAINASRRK